MPLFRVLHIRPALLGSEWLPGHLVIGAKTFQMIVIIYFQKLKYVIKLGYVGKKQPNKKQQNNRPTQAVSNVFLYLNLSVLV